jgi:predicted transcriptional regulator
VDLLSLDLKLNIMITKTQIITSLDKLPERLTIDQVVDHLIFVEKVQKGLDDSENGRINTKEEAKQKLKKWLK